MRLFKCVEEKKGFTVGKIYSVDDTLIDDNRTNRDIVRNALLSPKRNGWYYYFQEVSFQLYLNQVEKLC